MPSPRSRLTPASAIGSKPSPTCDACQLAMRWRGSIEGWACPEMRASSPKCRSPLYRPKVLRHGAYVRPDGKPDPWPPEERYPELYADEAT